MPASIMWVLASVAYLALMGAATELQKQQSILVSPPIEDFEFIGCFFDSLSREAQGRDKLDHAVIMEYPTINTCVSYCNSLSFTLAGVGNGK